MKQINILLILATLIFISYATFITIKSNKNAKLLNDQFREEKFQQAIVEENALVKVRELIAKAKLHRLGKNLRTLPKERLLDYFANDSDLKNIRSNIKACQDAIEKGNNIYNNYQQLDKLQIEYDARMEILAPKALETYQNAINEVEDIRSNNAKEFVEAYNRIVAEIPLNGMSESLANDFIALAIYSGTDAYAVIEKLKFNEKLQRAKDIFEFAKAIEIDEVKPEEKEVMLTAYKEATPSSEDNWIELVEKFLLSRKGKYKEAESVISLLEKGKSEENEYSFWKFYFPLPENIRKDILEHFLKGTDTGYWPTWRDNMISHIKQGREQKIHELEEQQKKLHELEFELIAAIYQEEKKYFNEENVTEFFQKASKEDIGRFKKILNNSPKKSGKPGRTTYSSRQNHRTENHEYYTFRKIQEEKKKLEEEITSLKKIPNRQVMRGIFLFENQSGRNGNNVL